MARHKGYVREEAVQKARNAFWEHGYRALGIRAIEQVVGLGRFAIRTDFKGKEGLFLEVLQAYRTDGQTSVTPLIDAGDDLSTIEEILTRLITPAEGSHRKFGCLMINTIAENGTLQNPAFKKETTQYFGDIRAAIIRLLERARAKGEVRKEVDLESAGDFVIGCLVAIHLINRDAQDITAATGYVKTAMTTIDSWRR